MDKVAEDWKCTGERVGRGVLGSKIDPDLKEGVICCHRSEGSEGNWTLRGVHDDQGCVNFESGRAL